MNEPVLRDPVGYIFDLDGTLLDSMGFLSDIACDVLKSIYGLDDLVARQAYQATSGRPFDDQIHLIQPGDPRNHSAVSLFNEMKHNHYFESKFFDDVLPTLTVLKKRGAVLFVSSNNDHDIVLKKMAELAIEFEVLLGMKPGFLKGRAHFELIRSKNLCQSYVFIGDSMHDLKMARENDIPFFARVGTFQETDFSSQKDLFGFSKSIEPLLSLNPPTEVTRSPSPQSQPRAVL